LITVTVAVVVVAAIEVVTEVIELVVGACVEINVLIGAGELHYEFYGLEVTVGRAGEQDRGDWPSVNKRDELVRFRVGNKEYNPFLWSIELLCSFLEHSHFVRFILGSFCVFLN